MQMPKNNSKDKSLIIITSVRNKNKEEKKILRGEREKKKAGILTVTLDGCTEEGSFKSEASITKFATYHSSTATSHQYHFTERKPELKKHHKSYYNKPKTNSRVPHSLCDTLSFTEQLPC